MPRTCCYPKCLTGSDKERRKIAENNTKAETLFKAPKDYDLFKKWKKAIPSGGKKFTSDSYVCALHFNDEDIDSYYQVKLPDGTIYRVKKRSLLKEGAVPVNSKRRKRKVIDTDQKVIEYSFQNLKMEIPNKNIDSAWTYTIADKFVALLFWEETNILKIWIKIEENLDARIFISGCQYHYGKKHKINSFNKLVHLMHFAEKINFESIVKYTGNTSQSKSFLKNNCPCNL